MNWISFLDQYPPNDVYILLKVHPIGLYEVGKMIDDEEDGMPRLLIHCGQENESSVLISDKRQNGGFTHWCLID